MSFSPQTVTLTSARDSKNHYITLKLTETAVDEDLNTSTISYELKAYTAGSYSWSSLRTGYSVTINGVVVASMARASAPQTSCSGNGGSVIIISGTTTVTHDADGTKTISASASANNQLSGSTYMSCSLSVAEAMTLYEIQKLSSLTNVANSYTTGSQYGLTISPIDPSYTHSITYSVADQMTSGVILEKSSSLSASFNIPHSAMPTKSSAQLTITLNTYNGDTLVGSSNYTSVLNVPSNLVPSVALTVSQESDITWLQGKTFYVAGYSKARLTITASASNGSSISRYVLSGDIASAEASSTVSTVLATSGTYTEAATVYDREDRSSSVSRSISVLAYTPPSASIEVERGTLSGSTWTSDINGRHLRISANLTMSLESNGNRINVTATLDGTQILSAPNQTSGAKVYYYTTETLPENTYELIFSASDYIGNTYVVTEVIESAEVPMNMNFDLPGIAIGGIADRAKALQMKHGWKLLDEDGNEIGGGSIDDTTTTTTSTWSSSKISEEIGSSGGGTITGIKMNGSTVGTSGVVDLGTVVQAETDPTVPSWAKQTNKPSYTASEIVPLQSKTYEGVYAEQDNDTYGYKFYGNIRPTSYKDLWHIKLKIKAYVPNNLDYNSVHIVDISGMRTSYSAYACWNNIQNQSYRTFYYTTLRNANSEANTTTYGHIIGWYLRSCANYTNQSYKRTYEIELLECDNCTFTFLDEPTIYSNIVGTGNYGSNNNFDCASQGLRETGDDNTPYTYNSYERWTTDSVGLNGAGFCMEQPYNKIGQLTTTSSTSTTDKSKNQNGFLVGSDVWYNNGYTVSANTTFSQTYRAFMQQYHTYLDFRYTSNCGTTLVGGKPIYLVGTVQNGLFYLDDAIYTQTEPTEEDGKVYVYIGNAYDTYRVTLHTTKYWMQYRDGAFQLYSPIKVSELNAKADKATTLSGYGITDASINTSTRVITLGANSITVPTSGGGGQSSITGVTAGTGLSGGGTDGNVTINHSNSVTAQNTQAIYPIKIDAQGHISAYGSSVTPLTASSTLDATKVSGTLPSSTYTNTVTTATTSGSGNAVTSITATNGALTVTKGSTFLTEHQDISGKQDKITSTNKLAYSLISGTPSSLPASDVSDWAKASSKPSYSADEVGALPINGGTLTGSLQLNSANYGTSLPSSGTEGQIFFLIV